MDSVSRRAPADRIVRLPNIDNVIRREKCSNFLFQNPNHLKSAPRLSISLMRIAQAELGSLRCKESPTTQDHADTAIVQGLLGTECIAHDHLVGITGMNMTHKRICFDT